MIVCIIYGHHDAVFVVLVDVVMTVVDGHSDTAVMMIADSTLS